MAKKKSTEEIKKPKAISPFDIIGMMFTDRGAFSRLTSPLLTKNFFMINRVMAINFPLQAQCFNKLNINQADVVRSWASFAPAKCGFGRVPSFVYTRGAKKADSDSTVVDIDKDLKVRYCMKYDLSFKDFEDLLFFNHDATLEHIRFYEKMEDVKEQAKNVEKLKSKTKK